MRMLEREEAAETRQDAVTLRFKKAISLAKTQSTQRNGFWSLLAILAALREKLASRTPIPLTAGPFGFVLLHITLNTHHET